MFMYILPFTPWNHLFSCKGALVRTCRARAAVFGRIPARKLAGGEGQVGEGLEEVEPHLLVALACGEVV